MSTSSTVRCFGTTKTYGRTREKNSSTSFDEKPVPIKASPGQTKWGRTSFVAVRQEKKSMFEPPEEPVKKEAKPEDPFSFDTEDKRKRPRTQRNVVEVEPQKISTRLPASRIVTQGKKGPEVQPKDFVGADNDAVPVTRTGRTYSRLQKAPPRPEPPSSELIMDQFVEVGKTVKTDSGYEVVYSIEPHEPTSRKQVPETVRSESPPVLPEQQKTAPKTAPKRSKGESASAKPVSAIGDAISSPRKSAAAVPKVEEEEDDDDIFPVMFNRTPLKTYTGEIITPIMDIPDEPVKKKSRRTPTGLPRGRRPSRYTDPTLIEEYRKRYEETHGKREPTAGMFNSTVVSSKELKGKQGTTLVVVCKPKMEALEKKDDVQTKYFKNVQKELNKSDKNLEAVGNASKENANTELPAVSKPVVAGTPSPIMKKPSTTSQDTNSNSTPSRVLKVRFADEEACSAANTLTSLSSSLTQKQSSKSATAASKNSSQSQSSQESVSSENSSNSASDQSSVTIASRTRSGGKQYRIFKSRGPQQPVAKETSKEEESANLEDSATKPDSPPMPELTPEVSNDSNSEDTTGQGQNPPNIIDEEESSATDEPKTAADSPQVSQDQETPDSQVSQQSVEDTAEKAEVSPSSQARPSDSEETPPPAVPDDSQELSQEISSSAEGSQNEDNTPAVPRRFFKSKTSSNVAKVQAKVSEKSPSKASYNVRSWQQEGEGADKESEGGPSAAKRAKKVLPFSDEPEGESTAKTTKGPRLTRSVHWPKDNTQQAYTSVKVQKKHKDLYTVVHNVKMAYEVQESGETQDFMDDVEYLLENLKDSQPQSIRALSTIQLAAKCISPAFRMHLRAHGTVTKIFSLLHDACSFPNLALSTASMMFMLSRDRLNMDLDKDSLHLMLKLNEVDMPRSSSSNNSSISKGSSTSDGGNSSGGGESQGEGSESQENVEDSTELEKCSARVQEMLEQLQKETNAKEIDLDFVSTGNLAMESLLSLTSRRAGEWFKEELRMLGGLDHFVETIHRCGSGMTGDLASNLDKYTPSLKKLDRCLRVLENITLTNTDNQNHIIAYNNGLLVTATGRVLQQCVQCLPTMPLQEVESEVELKEQAGWIVFDCLLAILRVLLNVTHDSEQGSSRVDAEKDVMHSVLMCVASTQWCVPLDQRFDLLVLSLGLLINLVEHCPSSRQYLVECKLMTQTLENTDPTEMGAIQVLVQLFLQRETAARQMEEAPETPSKADDSVNKSGEWRESDSGIQWIARSAEKVKAAEELRKGAVKDGESSDGGGGSDEKEKEPKEGDEADRSMDGASILEDEETFTKALHKAGKHMENSIVASYVGLLLGCLIQANQDNVEIVRKHLPDGSFDSMIKILKKFLGFMNLTTAVGTTDAISIQKVIDTLEAC